MSDWKLYTYTNLALSAGLAALNATGYRPFGWSGYSSDLLVYLKSNIGGYFFDAVIREVHSSALRITEHPVQSGANISDHAHQVPARLVMEIGMSDAMASLMTNQYGIGEGKSVNAYQTLLALQAARTPLTVVTRLQSYDNMIIEQIFAPDDKKTTHGLKCSVSLRQIITATVAETTVVKSSDPQTTNETSKGAVQAEGPKGSALYYGESYILGKSI